MSGAAQVLWLPQVNDELIIVLSVLLLTARIISQFYQWVNNSCFFLAGLLITLLSCQIQLQSELTVPIEITFQGYVDSLPKVSNQKTSFITQNSQTQQKFLLNWYHKDLISNPDFKVGQLYQFKTKIKPPFGTANGIGFDREKWLFRNQIDGVGTIREVHPLDQYSNGFKHRINRWRLQLSTSIKNQFKTSRVNGLIHALSIGDKSHIEHQDFELFQSTGTAHLIAISGLHIGMVALMGWLLGGFIFWLFPNQRLPKPIAKILCGMLLATLYASLAGFSVSTQRALIMLLVYACYKIFRTGSYAWDVWSFSLLAVLLMDPLNVLDAGFWLSFGAVAVLILSFNGIPQTDNKMTSFIKMQWHLLIGMLPLSLIVFTQINLTTPLVNLLMIPLMTFVIIPLIFLMLLISMVFTSIPESLVTSISWVCELFLFSLDWFAQHARWTLNVAIHYGWQIIILIIGALILTLPKAIPQRFWGFGLIIISTISPKRIIPYGHFNAYFLDVGQGLSVLIETQNHTMMYDVGAAFESGFNYADVTLIPFLKDKKINNLDALILSHQDNDHAGSTKFLSAQIPINQTWGTQDQHQACVAGTSWHWDGVSISVLSPNNLTPYLKNNSSCVVKIKSIQSSLLLTGDIEDPVEFRLSLLPKEQIQADVIMVPHHGSKTSSSIKFIQQVDPQIAINSSGKYNPFNHPAPTVLKKYEILNIPVLDTQNSGLLSLSTYPELSIQSFRQQFPKIWRKKNPAD